MTIDRTATVAVVATGEMGAAVAAVLAAGGASVVTALEGRSPRTHRLAEQAGIRDVGSVAAALAASGTFLSIVPPGQARRLAAQVAEALHARPRELLYLDCNAVSPATTDAVGALLSSVGATFVDAGIIGFPPQPGPQATRLYVSGPHAERALALGSHGLDVRVAGDQFGQASALKMCYAALTKGLTAIGTASLTVASRRGLARQLLAELELSQPVLLPWLERMLTSSPPKSYRWIAEMEEIALTFESDGLGAELFEGVADVYRALAETGLGRETPETRRQRTLSELGEELAADLPPVGPAVRPSGPRR